MSVLNYYIIGQLTLAHAPILCEDMTYRAYVTELAYMFPSKVSK
jgi:hypothetical protein